MTDRGPKTPVFRLGLRMRLLNEGAVQAILKELLEAKGHFMNPNTKLGY